MQLDEYYDLTVDQFLHYQKENHEKDYILVDVRLPEEYEDEHIPGAMLIPLADLTARITELPNDRDVIFYCNSGRRSKAAALFATSVPYFQQKVFNILGGILGYFNKMAKELKRCLIITFAGLTDNTISQWVAKVEEIPFFDGLFTKQRVIPNHFLADNIFGIAHH